MKHGHSPKRNHSRTYRIWQNMKTRCGNAKASNYAFYGGRGIRVCERWMDFSSFLADMGIAPDVATLDRIDGTGNYEPSNCRWVSHQTQCRNRRNNRVIEFSGESLCVASWSDRTGVPIKIICQRLDRGWSVEMALSQ